MLRAPHSMRQRRNIVVINMKYWYNNAMVVDLIPTRGNEISDIFISSVLWFASRQRTALSSVTQRAMPLEFVKKWRTEVS